MNNNRTHILKIVLITILSLFVTLIVLFALLFSAFRWWTSNDEQDVQGKWSLASSDSTITINDTEIRLSEDTIFTYKIDTSTKMITENISNMSGKAHYVFSADKTEMVIIDEDLDFLTSTFLDAGNLLLTFFTGNYADSSAGFLDFSSSEDSIVRLHRVS